MGSLVAWLRNNCSPTSGLTHLSLAGGRFTVPPGLEGAFIHKYAKAVKAGLEPLFLSEVRTATFKLFMDLDWCSPQPISAEDQQAVARFIAQQVLLIWEIEQPLECVVCTRAAVLQADGLFKSGMHLHWPAITTTADAALAFRQATVDRCRAQFGEGKMGREWGSVIDECVYRSSGLRMAFSCKKIREDIYRPSLLVTVSATEVQGLQMPSTEVKDISDTAEDWIGHCSIRYHGPLKTKVQECVDVAILHKPASSRSPPQDIGPHKDGLQELRKALPACYRNVRFTKLVKGESGSKYILATNSRTCLNLEAGADGQPGQHKSNNIFFVVDSTSTHQQCHCSCEGSEGRVHGPCKDFRSNGFPTPQVLAETLFAADSAEPPEQTQNQNQTQTDQPALPPTGVFALGRGVSLTTKPSTAEDIFKRFFDAPPSPKRQKPNRRRGHGNAMK